MFATSFLVSDEIARSIHSCWQEQVCFGLDEVTLQVLLPFLFSSKHDLYVSPKEMGDESPGHTIFS